MPRTLSLCALAGAAVTLTAVSAADASVLSQWNLMVRNNVNTTSEVDGSALVGGGIFGTSNFAVQGVTASSGDGLAVGGNIGSGINVQINNGGNLRIAGSVLGTRNLNGGGAQINDPTVPALVAAAFNEAASISAYLATLPANGAVDGAGNMNAAPALINGTSVAVYNLSSSLFVNPALGQLNLNFGSAQTVVINVSAAGTAGLVDLVAPPNLLGGFSQANSSRIIWNFTDATELIVNNTFNGAALAVNADLRLLGGAMNGTVVVNSLSQQDAEVRRFTYTGFVPTPGAATVLARAAIPAARRRRA